LTLVLLSLIAVQVPANAVGGFANASVADVALRYVGRWGGDACRDAGKFQSGQCKQFVNCVIVLAGGAYAGDGTDDYAGSYVRAGGTEISEVEAVKGDIIQWGSGSTPGKHTAIVITNLGGGAFEVVDSNAGSPANNEIVKQHTFANIHSANMFLNGGAEPTRFIRMGTVTTDPPTPKDSDNDGVLDPSDLCVAITGPSAYRGCPYQSTSTTVAVDVNHDGYRDVIAFYDYGGGNTSAFWFKGYKSGLRAPVKIWSSGAGNWEWSHVKLVSGDINHDGYGDVVAFYDYGGGNTSAFWFKGYKSGLRAPVKVWNSGAGNWEWDRTKLVSTDVNHDGYTDVVAFYDYSADRTAAFWFKGSKSGLKSPAVVWDSGSGNWDWSRTKLVAGDINRDGYGDIVALYDYSGADSRAWLFKGSKTGLKSPKSVWDSGSGNWEWSHVKLVAADNNHDGYADLVAFYDYGGGNTSAFWFKGYKSGLRNPVRVWSSGAGNWEWSHIKIVASDLNHDGYADVAAFYDYGGGNTAAFWFKGSKPGLKPPKRTWSSGTGSWEWDRM